MARKQWWLAALLFGATLLAYWPALAGGFIWNDSDYVTAPALRSWDGLARIWFEIGAVQQYYPVLHTAFWIEHRLWGDHPFGYHLVNVLLHGTAACLFALALIRVAGETPAGAPVAERASVSCDMPWPWLAAFLFALHPVCVESVAWISEEKNTLSTVFYLAAAYVYFGWRGGARRRSDYLLATLLYVLALLSKSVAATLPAAILVVLWWRNGRLDWRRDVRPLLPWLALGAAGGLFTAWVEYRYVGAEGATFALSFLQRFLVAGRAAWFYLGKLVWPHPLIFIYPRWAVNASAPWQYLFPFGALAALGALWASRRRTRGPLAAALFFLGSLFPVLGFFNVYAFTFSFVADHFQYLPCLGMLAAAAGGLCRLARDRSAAASPAEAASAAKEGRSLMLTALTIGLLVVLCALTRRECRKYRDLPTFYGAILERNPGAWMAHTNLAAWLAGQGRKEEAQAHYDQALRLQPGDLAARDNLGLLLAEQGRFSEAIDRFRSLLRDEPRFADAHRNLANALLHSGRGDEALAEYGEAIRLSPKDAHAWNDCGNALFTLHRVPEAEQYFERAVRLDSGLAEAHDNLGNALASLGRMDDAIAEYEEALHLEPDRGSTRSNLGMALARSGRMEDALRQFQTALRSNPKLEEARNNLGNVLLALGRPEEAAEQFEAALRLNPNSVQANNNLGNVLAQTGRLSEAVGRYQAALLIDPAYLESQVNLGIVLVRLGRLDEGVTHLQAALRIDPSSLPARRALDRAEALLHSK